MYVDTEKKCYRDIEYKRYNALSVLGAVISKKTRDLNNLASKEGLKGNMKGDLLQTGGLLIVKKGELSSARLVDLGISHKKVEKHIAGT